jgi:hypothetical protein
MEEQNKNILNTENETELHDDHHEVYQEQELNFESYNTDKLSEIMSDYAKSDDFKNNDNAVKKLKDVFDEKLEENTSKALENYISTGGEKDDFEYRKSESERKFETAYKTYRDRRATYLKDLEVQKNNNLVKKTSLINTLRELNDKINDTKSLQEVRRIQDEWKSIGAVPKANSEEIWQTYHALLDIFYSNYKLNFEFIELDRKRNLEQKSAIVEKIEALADEPIIKNALKSLSELENEWKHIGPVFKEESDKIWERFRGAVDKIYDKKRAFLAEKELEFSKNLELKKQVAEKVKELENFTSDRIQEWKKQTEQILKLQEEWKSIGHAKKEDLENISKEFWGAYKNFFNTKSAFFKTLYDARLENLKSKNSLIEEVEAILNNPELEANVNKVIEIQKKWKTIGPVPDKFNNSVWEKFRATCDKFFENKRNIQVEKDSANKEKLAVKYQFCDTLEEKIKDDSIAKDIEFVNNAKNEWITTHKSDVIDNKLEKRFYTLMKEAVSKIAALNESQKMDYIYELEVESMKSQSNSGELLNQKSIQLRKQVREVEDQISNINNNLAFFGNSKNADALKADYIKQIEQLEQKLEGLKKYLKVLYK